MGTLGESSELREQRRSGFFLNCPFIMNWKPSKQNVSLSSVNYSSQVNQIQGGGCGNRVYSWSVRSTYDRDLHLAPTWGRAVSWGWALSQGSGSDAPVRPSLQHPSLVSPQPALRHTFAHLPSHPPLHKPSRRPVLISFHHMVQLYSPSFSCIFKHGAVKEWYSWMLLTLHQVLKYNQYEPHLMV